MSGLSDTPEAPPSNLRNSSVPPSHPLSHRTSTSRQHTGRRSLRCLSSHHPSLTICNRSSHRRWLCALSCSKIARSAAAARHTRCGNLVPSGGDQIANRMRASPRGGDVVVLTRSRSARRRCAPSRGAARASDPWRCTLRTFRSLAPLPNSGERTCSPSANSPWRD